MRKAFFGFVLSPLSFALSLAVLARVDRVTNSTEHGARS